MINKAQGKEDQGTNYYLLRIIAYVLRISLSGTNFIFFTPTISIRVANFKGRLKLKTKKRDTM